MSEINFVEVDAKSIEQELIQTFEQALKETLYPGDERRIFLMQMVPVLVGVKNSINDSAKQNLLRFARGQVLDELGGYHTPRLQPQKAVVNVDFTLSGVQTNPLLIPKGTRVTPDGVLYFATTKDITIPSGSLTGPVLAEATEAGEKHNGFAPGQIKSIVDPVPFVAAVTNTDTSRDGAPMEDDESYRQRIRMAPESFSVAGPEGAYIYWAKTADPNILDLSVISPTPGTVKITVLMENGDVPHQSTLDAVNAACNDKKRRPLTDQVLVQAPTIVNYNLNLTYFISSENATFETTIRSNIEGTGGAIEQYKTWQASKLGRAINPDFLRQLMLNAGACRINLTAPVYTSINPNEVAKCTTVTVNYGGMM